MSRGETANTPRVSSDVLAEYERQKRLGINYGSKFKPPPGPKAPPSQRKEYADFSTKQIREIVLELQESVRLCGIGSLAFITDDRGRIVTIIYHRRTKLPIETIFHEYWRSHRSPQRTGQTLDFIVPDQLGYAKDCVECDKKLSGKQG